LRATRLAAFLPVNIIHMQVRKNYLLFFGILLFAACKKDSGTTTTTGNPVDDCTIQLNPLNGTIINGRYIIAMKDASNMRTMSAGDLARYSGSLLERNNIRSSAMLQSFGGEPSGFIASLSPDEAGRLRRDAGIAIIEPDRIVALGD
jgi:hypothetical protein